MNNPKPTKNASLHGWKAINWDNYNIVQRIVETKVTLHPEFFGPDSKIPDEYSEMVDDLIKHGTSFYKNHNGEITRIDPKAFFPDVHFPNE